MLQNHQWVKDFKIKQKLNLGEMKTQTYQNLWDAEKTDLKGKFITINAYIKNQEISQMNNLTLYLKWLEKEE